VKPVPTPPVLAPHPRRDIALAALAAALLATVLYLPSVVNPMIWDDNLHVPIAIKMKPMEAFGPAGGAYRRPLVLLSYAAQSRLAAASARDLHAANALIHGANAALVVAVLVGLGGAVPLAFAAAVLFAFHPLASGSVAYISGRTDLLATLFTLLAVWLSAPGPRSGTGAWSAWKGSALACLAVAAAALSKESGLAAGPLVAAVLWWRRAAGDRSVTVARLALAPAVSAALALVVVPDAAATTVSTALRLRGVGTALVTYAGLVVWPAGLHLDRLTPVGSGAAAVLGGVAVAAAAAALAIFAKRPTRAGLLAVALVLLYAPGSGIVPVYPSIADRLVFTGEQFLYAPMIVIAALVVTAGAMAVERFATGLRGASSRGSGEAAGEASRGALAVVAVAASAALAWTPVVLARQGEFASEEQVYRTTLEHSPSPRACFNLGGLFLARRDYGEAVSVYERCVAMAPGDAGTYGQFAVALQQAGKPDDARRAYERSTTLDSRNALVWSNFATLDANSGRLGDARTKWERALSIDPGEKTARAALARLNAATR